METGVKGRLRQAGLEAFRLLDRLGLHVLPKTYYSPVPDWAWLTRHKESWMGRVSVTGVRWDLDEQLGWVAEICRPYSQEVSGLDFYRRAAGNGFGPGFGPIESQVLHCFVRANAPSRIVEVGSGVSTVCMLNAARRNQEEGRRVPEIVCIEPYPRPGFRDIGPITHIKQACQLVAPAVFARLGPGDLLFIDSSHAVKVGSDVMRLYLEIIPGLAPGVTIHIHDIFLPYIYPRSAFTYPSWSQETALLLALLINNPRLRVLASLSALHYDRPGPLGAILPDYRPQANIEGVPPAAGSPGHFPNSAWLTTC